jgi:hypothetical protein
MAEWRVGFEHLRVNQLVLFAVSLGVSPIRASRQRFSHRIASPNGTNFILSQPYVLAKERRDVEVWRAEDRLSSRDKHSVPPYTTRRFLEIVKCELAARLLLRPTYGMTMSRSL